MEDQPSTSAKRKSDSVNDNDDKENTPGPSCAKYSGPVTRSRTKRPRFVSMVGRKLCWCTGTPGEVRPNDGPNACPCGGRSSEGDSHMAIKWLKLPAGTTFAVQPQSWVTLDEFSEQAEAGLDDDGDENLLRKLLSDKELQCRQIVDGLRYMRRRYYGAVKELEFIKQNPTRSLSTYNASVWLNQHFQWTRRFRTVLQDTFHISDFRRQQTEIINFTMCRMDVVAVVPSSVGKSITFQLPASVSSMFTLVIEPNDAVIVDQLILMSSLNIHCAGVIEGTSGHDMDIIENFMTGRKPLLFKILYVKPSVFTRDNFLDKLYTAYEINNLDRIVIDEMQCCSPHSHDFRQEYINIYTLKRRLPNVPILAMTSAAPKKVVEDCKELLRLTQAVEVSASFNMTNIFYRTLYRPDTIEDQVGFFTSLLATAPNKTGLIFVYNDDDCVGLARRLREAKINARAYHGGLSSAIKKSIYKDWISGVDDILVTTSVLGMGIDFKNTYFVIHASTPKNLSVLYQESCRSGRGGRKGVSLLLYTIEDIFDELAKCMNEYRDPTEYIQMLRYCTYVNSCRRKCLAEYFAEEYVTEICRNMCDVCRSRSDDTVEFLTVWYDVCPVLHDFHAILGRYGRPLSMNTLVDIWSETSNTKISHMETLYIASYFICEGYLIPAKGEENSGFSVKFAEKFNSKDHIKMCFAFPFYLDGFTVVIPPSRAPVKKGRELNVV